MQRKKGVRIQKEERGWRGDLGGTLADKGRKWREWDKRI